MAIATAGNHRAGFLTMTQETALAATPATGVRARSGSGSHLWLSARGHIAAALGYGFAASVVLIGWIFRDDLAIEAGEGLGFYLGILGGSLMLLLLLYSVRKRFKFMRRGFGKTRYWFRIHMILGVVGPVVILYHCRFQLGSVNSQVALYCTLLVAGSGLIGRYLYAQIHHGLYGRKASLQELTLQMSQSKERMSSADHILGDLRTPLAAIGDAVLETPDTVLSSALRPMVMAIRTRWLYLRLCWQIKRRLIARSVNSSAVEKHRHRLENATQRYLQHHLREIRQVAQFGFYERLFSWWHVVHVPVFILMLVTAVVHVVAVHMY